jgi:hypothetical protein
MPEEKTERQKHLEWCKERALQYVEAGELTQAYSSMASDMRKHKETENHMGLELGLGLLMGGHLDTAAQMKKFIEDFN